MLESLLLVGRGRNTPSPVHHILVTKGNSESPVNWMWLHSCYELITPLCVPIYKKHKINSYRSTKMLCGLIRKCRWEWKSVIVFFIWIARLYNSASVCLLWLTCTNVCHYHFTNQTHALALSAHECALWLAPIQRPVPGKLLKWLSGSLHSACTRVKRSPVVYRTWWGEKKSTAGDEDICCACFWVSLRPHCLWRGLF